MKKATFLLALLGVAYSTLCFQCESHCFDNYIPVKSTNQAIAHLDNRGPAPIVLSPGSQGWKNAYGLRLSQVGEPTITGATTTDVCSIYYFLEPGIQDIKIITLTGLGMAYPVGADVSGLFQVVNSSSGRYLPMSDATTYLNTDWAIEGANSADFLLTQTPETPGWQQFEVQLAFSDTTTLSIKSDSIFLQ